MSAWAKLDPLRSKSNELLEINVLRKFTSHALCSFENLPRLVALRNAFCKLQQLLSTVRIIYVAITL